LASKRTLSKILHTAEAAIASLALGLSLFFVCRYAVGISFFLFGIFGFLLQNTTQWFSVCYHWGLQLGGFVGVVAGAATAFYTFRVLIATASRWLHFLVIIIVAPVYLYWTGIIAPFMLDAAIDEGNIAHVNLLVTLGANFEKGAARDSLEAAARAGNEEIVSLLIDRGAKIHQEALFSAIASNNPDVVAVLIENGADMNGIDQNGRTPLISAIYGENEVIVKLLLANGADANINQPLNAAIIAGRADIASQLLASGANINTGTRSSDIPLHMAAKTNQYDMIQLLIQYGANVDYKSTTPNQGSTEGVGLTALEVAFRANQMNAVRALRGNEP
jgi:Ankyrin repeats (3 copies)/Ankyrin repeat